ARVLTADGVVLADGFVTGGGTELAPLTGSVELTASPAGPAYLVLWEASARDGSITRFTVTRFELPDPGDTATGNCSAAGLDVPSPTVGLPDAVNATRTAIATAAVNCDWDALFALIPDDGFNAGFGDVDAEDLWPAQEAAGEE